MKNDTKEALINSSFRMQQSEDPESMRYASGTYWIPAFAGMTELIRQNDGT